jgi:hypothetical protein
MMIRISVYLLTLIPFVLQAQLSPGKLHQSHTSLEGIKNCSLCHGIGQKISAENCLNCHVLLKDRISRGKGLHASSEYGECQKCHVEHHGRNFDLIYWENRQDNFNHQRTGFLLKGKHAELKCRDCHQPKFIRDKATLTKYHKDLNRTFLGLQTGCTDCHLDEHRGQLGNSCMDCHQMNSWKPAPLFDHSKTSFPLTGKHQDVLCGKCHPTTVDNRFPQDKSYLKFTGLIYSKCTDCHQDVHKNRFGKNCTSCHSTAGWTSYKQAGFNHDMTQYPLRGKHRLVPCEKCHLPGKVLTTVSYGKCADCHRDYHQGQFSERPQKGECGECHTVSGFSPAFFTIEHHNLTDFKLDGAHRAIPCIACHKKTSIGFANETIRFRFTSTTCQSCHQDPHNKTADKFMSSQGCKSCHGLDSWRQIKFNHDQTSFPLELKHAEIACSSCHPADQKGNVPLVKISVACMDCHKDPHFGQFLQTTSGGEKIILCGNCHIPRNWKAEKFDHNVQASFKLEGAHQLVKCEKCHPTLNRDGKQYTVYKPLKSGCADCHGNRSSKKKENSL